MFKTLNPKPAKRLESQDEFCVCVFDWEAAVMHCR